jgi:hypothetical protein
MPKKLFIETKQIGNLFVKDINDSNVFRSSR